MDHISVRTESGDLVIRVARHAIVNAAKHHPNIDASQVLVDEDVLLADLVIALSDQDDDGYTPVMRMVDESLLCAFDSASEAWEDPSDYADDECEQLEEMDE